LHQAVLQKGKTFQISGNLFLEKVKISIFWLR
jgi:hypothetical protein